MENSHKNNVIENNAEAESLQKIDTQIKPKDQSDDKEKLIIELIEMGFSKPLVQQVVDNAGDVPKNLIVEQLLTSNYNSNNSVPLVDDDNDSLWEDVIVSYKMVIVINKDLNMGIGKIASQTAHASVGLYNIIRKTKELKNDLSIWEDTGSRKIVVEATNTNQLVKLCSSGKLHNIPYYCVYDAGLTEVVPNSFTALAFFGTDDQLKPVTGKLRLLK